MAKEVRTESMRLIIENGEEIEITYPVDIVEGLFEEMREAQSRDGFWYVGNYSDARAVYKGAVIYQVNMKRVIGTA